MAHIYFCANYFGLLSSSGVSFENFAKDRLCQLTNNFRNVNDILFAQDLALSLNK